MPPLPRFLNSVFLENEQAQKTTPCPMLSFKDQGSADFVRIQFKDLSNNIGNPTQSVLTSLKIGEQLELHEKKGPVVSRHCVVYQFKCDM